MRSMIVFGLLALLVVAITVPAPAHAQLTVKEQLGKALFFEKISSPDKMSCADCHAPAAGWTGPNPGINAHGAVYRGAVPQRFGNRKPPSAGYATSSPNFHYDTSEELFVGGNFWDGRATGDHLGNPAADQALGPFLNPVEQNNPSKLAVLQQIAATKFAPLWTVVWGSPLAFSTPAEIEANYDRVGLAIAAYEASSEVNAFSSKYDWYLRGDIELTAKETWGMELFEGKAMCSGCHPAPLFTDFTFDNLGVPKNPENPFYGMDEVYLDGGTPINPEGANWIDPGLGGYLATLPVQYFTDLGLDRDQTVAENWGKHKVPTLRNVDKRPGAAFPKAYAHNGAFKSLKEIVHFYNTRDVAVWPPPEVADNVNADELGNLGLTDAEEDAVVAFLGTLSDGFRPTGRSSRATVTSFAPVRLEVQRATGLFSPATRLVYSVPQSGDVRLAVYDVAGRRVATLVDGWKSAGSYTVEWTARDVASGNYLILLDSGSARVARKINILTSPRARPQGPGRSPCCRPGRGFSGLRPCPRPRPVVHPPAFVPPAGSRFTRSRSSLDDSPPGTHPGRTLEGSGRGRRSGAGTPSASGIPCTLGGAGRSRMVGALRSVDLASCDILLYRGRGWISKAIMLFDGAEVSHAGLFLGRAAVAEALSAGVVRRDLATSVATADRVLVRRLAPAPRSLRPVHAHAVAVVAEGERYAYEQIVLLAFLCLARRLVPTPVLQRLVRGVLDRAAQQVTRLFAAGREPMICSEFVYRSYDEADPARDDVYAIDIPTIARRLHTRSAGDRARAVVPGRGRGIHVDSLLAGTLEFRARSAHRRGPQTGSRTVRARAVSDAELEQLFARHAQAQRTVAARRAPRTGAPRPELRAAVERFALAWSRGTRRGPRRLHGDGKPSLDAALDVLRQTVADFVTPGDLLRSPSLRTRGTLDLRARQANRRPVTARGSPPRVRPAPPPRRDDTGGTWTLADVEAALFDIVAALTPGVDRAGIDRSTRFGRDLGWDTWYTLRVILPVRERLHETLPAAVAKRLAAVGQLVDAVWSRMEELE